MISRELKFIYWLIPILLFVLQAVYTFNSLNQIRYEELEESVVSPYWVQNGVVQNGASGNLGWHFLLVAVYNIFGFSLFAGKFVRLSLVLISLFCLAAVLRKYLGEKGAFLPLLTIGLSPTLLYFNTQQTVYGIDLLYLPIILYLVTKMDFGKKSGNLVWQVLMWTLAMVAWMSYPTFIYYLPALLIFYLYKLRQSSGVKKPFFLIKNLSTSGVFFLLPLISAFIFIKNRNLLIYDENVGSGMFRGAGFVELSLGRFLFNLKLNLVNLFQRSYGYYFEIKKVEFSDFYPILVLFFIVFAIYKLWKKKPHLRIFILLALLILATNVFLAHFTIDSTPGMRRQTGSLAAIYGLWVLAWYFAFSIRKGILKKVFLVALSLFLIHHLFVYGINLIHLKDPSQFRETVWFKTTEDPNAILARYVSQIQREDVKLMCSDESGQPLNCRYSEVFAVLSASCLWNRLQCKGIYGYDLKTGDFLLLNIQLFNDYYFGRYGREIIAT